jgi:hypothetical protein
VGQAASAPQHMVHPVSMLYHIEVSAFGLLLLISIPTPRIASITIGLTWCTGYIPTENGYAFPFVI